MYCFSVLIGSGKYRSYCYNSTVAQCSQKLISEGKTVVVAYCRLNAGEPSCEYWQQVLPPKLFYMEQIPARRVVFDAICDYCRHVQTITVLLCSQLESLFQFSTIFFSYNNKSRSHTV